MKFAATLLISCMLHCVQSTAIVDPANNAAFTASTAATSGSLTLNVSLTAQGANHQNQAFSAILLKAGSPTGFIKHDATGITNGSGAATVLMRSVDSNKCMSGTSATLANGTYDLYFAINYAAQTIYSIFPIACGAPGYLISLPTPNQLYTHRSQITISGNSTVNIRDSNTTLGKGHTFQLAAVTPLAVRAFICYLIDPGAADMISTMPVAFFNGSTDGAGNATTTTHAGQTIYVAPGSYKYVCHHDANNDATVGNTGDKVATGTTSVTGLSTTYLTNGVFSTL